ncbi:MAG: hypothetical protein JSV21_03305 [Nitrospirota bacterium]|nr:MAG: hypothetical protein JSV21_03305 [Nitrospirota bacterium]
MKYRPIIIFALLFILTPTLAFADQLKVVTKENAIRKECKFFSPVKAEVRYDDIMDLVSKEGDWYKVKFGDTGGCIHKSAVEVKKFKLSGLFGKKAEASSDEVALAGKGFNPQVESAYRKKNPKLNFALVDRIEGLNVPQEQLMEFIEKGGLNLP